MTDPMFLTTTMSTATYGVAVTAREAASSDPTRFLSAVPPSIPADQRYYWTHEWQRDIRESMRALADGEYVEFDSDDPNDVVRWLLDADDEH